MVKSLEHMSKMSDWLSKTDLTFTTLKGSDASSRRSKIYKRIDNREIDVVIVSTIFDEAIDVSNVRTLIKASSGKSDVRTIQNLGRGMRLAKGKDKVLLIDFFDETHEYLERHARKRRSTYRKEGYEVETISFSEMKTVIDNEF
jgi:superfamily II DNA or RNA helicase